MEEENKKNEDLDMGLETEEILEKEQKLKRNFLKKQFVVAALFIFVGIAAASTAVFYFNLKESPEEVIEKMAAKMQEVKTYHYELDSKIKFGNADSDMALNNEFFQLAQLYSLETQDGIFESMDGTMDVEAGGDVDISDIQNLRFSSNIDIGLKVEPANGFGFNFGFGFAFKMIGGVYYFKIDNFPGMEMLPMDFSMIKDKWIKIDIEKLMEVFGVSLSEENREAIENLQNQELVEIQIEQYKKLMSEADLYIFKNAFEDQEINGIETYHYQVDIDISELKELILDFFEMSEVEEMVGEDFQEELEESYGELEQIIKSISMDMWIGKKDYYLYKAVTDVNLVDPDTDMNILSNTIINFSAFNEPVDVSIPINVISIEELFKGFFMMYN